MNKNIVEILKHGGIGVVPTDTIYGLVGSAFSKRTVQRMYKVRKRNPKKPLIILISSLRDLKKIGVNLSTVDVKQLDKFWPGKVSIILPCRSKRFTYLHRGTKSLAFRMPKKKSIIALLKKTGPLVAPSANPEGLSPATTIREARVYFGDKVDFYISRGRIIGKPSKLIRIKDGKVEILRK